MNEALIEVSWDGPWTVRQLVIGRNDLSDAGLIFERRTNGKSS